jgi:hypothetical protein
MTSFQAYYRNQYQVDILKFFSKIPERSKHTFEDKHVFTIQYQALSQDFEYLGFLNKEQKANFGTALFFTVLVDQVCYTHFNRYYKRFQHLTRYPKFVGNSASTDRTNFPPRDIFSAMNYKRDNKLENSARIDFFQIFNDAVPVMEQEVKSFFPEYLPEIDAQDFWNTCVKEFPFHP